MNLEALRRELELLLAIALQRAEVSCLPGVEHGKRVARFGLAIASIGTVLELVQDLELERRARSPSSRA